MARAMVIHSEDAICVMFNGDKRRPEPSTAVIRFPGGHVEVSRASDGSYWCHIERNLDERDEDAVAGKIVASRIDYAPADYDNSIPPLPTHDRIAHIAVRIERA